MSKPSCHVVRSNEVRDNPPSETAEIRSFHEDRLLSRREVEALFGIPKRYLEISATRGDGPRRILIGRSVRYRVADIRAWIRNAREHPGLPS